MICIRKQIPNVLTCSRIFCSILLIHFPAFSVPFIALYLFCGLSDMADGFLARITDSASTLGAKLDSVADLVFTATVFIKLFSEVRISIWLWLWIILITVIKIISMILGLVLKGSIIFEHTVPNKITGFLLFLFPMILPFADHNYITSIVCTFAFVSAIHELYCIKAGRVIM